MTTAYLQRFAWELRRRNRARGLSLCTHNRLTVNAAALICAGCGSTLQELEQEGRNGGT